MRRGKAEIYLHFVWATHRRAPLITPDVEANLYACIRDECEKQGCSILALGGMADHLHLAVRIPTKLSPAHLMQRVKGVSSALARQRLVRAGTPFGWQDGYGVYSFSTSHLDKVVAYVRNQKLHHSTGPTWMPWEEVAEDDSPAV